MTCNYPDLGSASENFPRGTTSQKHYPELGSDSGGVAKCRLFLRVVGSISNKEGDGYEHAVT